MFTTQEILSPLDNCDEEGMYNFINLEHPYIFTVDSRLNVFRSGDGRWAIVSEVLGYNPRGSIIALEIRYFGNCLVNLTVENGNIYNYYMAYPIDWDNFNETVEIESLNPDAAYWLVRGQQVPLSHNLQDYEDAGIELKEYEPGEISAEEAGRLLILKYQDLLRATDDELYKAIPADLEKILVIDEWYHQSFSQLKLPLELPDVQAIYNRSTPEVRTLMERDHAQKARINAEEWEKRPSSYETWQQIAEVIVSGELSKYQPTLKSNSHWSNWPEAGAL